MAIVALHSAATGLSALARDIDVIANNLANVNTVGFKASRANFEDLLYQERAQPGVENANGDQRPSGLYVGLGTRLSNTQFDFGTQGVPVNSGGELDMMIDGEGFFQVSISPDQGGGVGYTRAGNFTKNRDGEVVLGNSDGPRLNPPITIPADATGISITADGKVYAMTASDTDGTEVGQLQLATFVNPSGLKPLGGNLFIPTAASGEVVQGSPNEANFGRVVHRFTEGSNVDPVTQLVELIKAQRAFEMNSQSMQAADQTLQVVANLRR